MTTEPPALPPERLPQIVYTWPNQDPPYDSLPSCRLHKPGAVLSDDADIDTIDTLRPGDVIFVSNAYRTATPEFVSATSRTWRFTLTDLTRELSHVFTKRGLRRRLTPKEYTIYTDPYGLRNQWNE